MLAERIGLEILYLLLAISLGLAIAGIGVAISSHLDRKRWPPGDC